MDGILDGNSNGNLDGSSSGNINGNDMGNAKGNAIGKENLSGDVLRLDVPPRLTSVTGVFYRLDLCSLYAPSKKNRYVRICVDLPIHVTCDTQFAAFTCSDARPTAL